MIIFVRYTTNARESTLTSLHKKRLAMNYQFGYNRLNFLCNLVTGILLWAMLGAIMTCTSYLTYVYDPLQLIIKKMAILAPGSLFLKLWSAPPHEVLINVFIFNITNADEFLSNQEKLRVEEIGPYTYQ